MLEGRLISPRSANRTCGLKETKSNPGQKANPKQPSHRRGKLKSPTCLRRPAETRGLRRCGRLGRAAAGFSDQRGVREGWDAEGRVFDVSEAVRTARAWMRRRVEAGEPALSGMFTRAEVTYAWPREDGTVGSDREPVALFTGEAVHAYLGHLPDAAIEAMLNELAAELAPRSGRSASMWPSPTGPDPGRRRARARGVRRAASAHVRAQCCRPSCRARRLPGLAGSAAGDKPQARCL